MKKFLATLLTLCMLLSVVSVMAVNVSAAGEAVTPDTSWYDDHKEDADLYIDDAADLLGFAILLSGQITSDTALEAATADAKIFTGKTVHMRADIDLNPGWIAGSRTEAIGEAEGQLIVPANQWAAANGHGFTGMFDGAGHTISGLYFAAEGDKSGIFGNPRGGTAEVPVGVKNLAIVNSYLTSSGKEFGGLFGATSAIKEEYGNVLIENVYMDVIQYSTLESDTDNANIGGLLGRTYSESTVTIRNSVVNSKISSLKAVRASGGFIGLVVDKVNGIVLIEDCLFFGELRSKQNRDAAFVGRSSGKTTINRAIEAGDVYPATFTTDKKYTGSMIGWAINDQNIITNCLYTDIYIAKDGAYIATESLHGTEGSLTKENNTHVTDAEITGIAAAEKLAAAGLSETWTPTTTGLPMPRGLVQLFGEKLLDKKDTSATPVVKLAGYQVSDTQDEKFDLRLVATLKLPDGKTTADFTAVGFTVVANYGTTSLVRDYSADTVYSSVAGYTKDGTAVKNYTAEELGGDYLFVLPCRNVPANVGTITMEITVHYATAEGVTYGATQLITVDPASFALS